jgi:hypothetical protein
MASKIDKLIGRLATRSNCTGKAVISLNMGGEERLKNEICKLITVDEVIQILLDYNLECFDLPEIATKITELMKK